MTSTPTDEERLAGYAEDLIRGLTQRLPGWVERTINERLAAADGEPVESDAEIEQLDDEIEATLERVTLLLRADIDGQDTNPLAVVRSLVAPMTRYLAARSVETVQRDPDAQRLFPDDQFDLTPGAFSDIHPDLHLAGLSWGAAKAHIHLQRRRAEGMIQ